MPDEKLDAPEVVVITPEAPPIVVVPPVPETSDLATQEIIKLNNLVMELISSRDLINELTIKMRDDLDGVISREEGYRFDISNIYDRLNEMSKTEEPATPEESIPEEIIVEEKQAIEEVPEAQRKRRGFIENLIG